MAHTLSKPIFFAMVISSVAYAYPAAPAENTRVHQRATALLEGKVAEPAQRCVQTERLNGSVVPDSSTIIYRVNSSLAYKSDIGETCPNLTDDRTIVTRTYGTQLCAGDQFEVVDPRIGIEYGLCRFGEFVPYRTP